MKNNIRKMVHESIKKVLMENIESEIRSQFTDTKGKNVVEIDNFEEIKQLLSFNNPDDVYFVKLVKRGKDNPHAHMHGDEYPKYYLIHSEQELSQHEREIKVLCMRDNLRAYITANKRSLKDGMHWADIYKRDPRKYKHMIGHEIESAFGRSFENDVKRDVIMIDIDTNDKTVHQKVHDILKKYNVDIIMEYPSLNDGLHIFTKSQEQILDAYLCKEFLQFDGGQDLGRLSTVGMDIDKNALLYCCLEPQGYRGATNYRPQVQQDAIKKGIEYRKQMNDRYTQITGKKHK